MKVELTFKEFQNSSYKVINDVGKNQGLIKEKDGKLMGNDIGKDL